MNEKRSAVRHHCPSGPPRQLFFLGNEQVLNANVTDVSTQGIAFVSAARIEPGTHLLMEVLSPGRPRRHMELVRVVRSEPLEDGKWLTGCSFVEEF
jgi:PilZ domain